MQARTTSTIVPNRQWSCTPWRASISACSASTIALTRLSSSAAQTCGTMISGCTSMPSFVHSAAASRMARICIS